MKRLLLFLAAVLPAASQVQVRFSPEPMEVLRSMNVKRVGVWSVSLCSDYNTPVVIPKERIIIAAGPIRIVDTARAIAVINTGRASTKKAMVAEVLEYGLIGTAVFGGSGIITMTPKVLGSIAVATGVSHNLQDRLRSQLPALGPLTDNLLVDSVALSPLQCTTRTVFAGLMHNPQPITTLVLVNPTPAGQP